MSAPKSRLTAAEKQALLAKLIETHKLNAPAEALRASADVPESFYRIEKFPRYHQMQLHRALADKVGLKSPFFTLHEGIGRDIALIGGREVLNFSTYNYLGLNGDPRVAAAAHDAACVTALPLRPAVSWAASARPTVSWNRLWRNCTAPKMP